MTSNQLSQIEAVIFDFDGVLVDSEPISLGELQKSLAHFGIDLSWKELVGNFLGSSNADVARYIANEAGMDPGEEFPGRWQKRVLDGFAADLPLVPGAIALLDHLDSLGIQYCLASGSSIKRLAYALELIGQTERFENRAFSTELVAKGKPAPDIFVYAAAEMGIAPEKCMVVEDGLAGTLGAKAAGINNIVGFVGASHLADEMLRSKHSAALEASGASVIIDDLSALTGS